MCCVFAESAVRSADWCMVTNCVYLRKGAPSSNSLRLNTNILARRYASLYVQIVLLLPSTLCFSTLVKHNIQPYTAICSHIQPHATICDNIQPYTTMYGQIQPYTGIYSHMQPYVAIYNHMQPYTIIYGNIQLHLAISAIYKHVQQYTLAAI